MGNKLKRFLSGLKYGQKNFGETISIIINTLLLTVVYFLGVGLTSVFSKLVGKRFLDMKIDKKKNSYWEELNLEKKEMEEYYRQF